MKTITLSIVVAITAIVAVSCNQQSNKTSNQSENDTSAVAGMQDAGQTGKAEANDFSIAPIITDYLALKNALVSDNDKAAASAGETLLATLNKVDMKAIPADKHKQYMDIADDAKEHAEHIGHNIGNIAHQREHLASLSVDLKDLVALFGTSQTLYQDHCPMFNDGKGAVWFSEKEEIKNPYYGSKMLTCGKVEQTISKN